MSNELKGLMEEFEMNLHLETDLKTHQAKELKSLQKAIRIVAEKEWENMSYEEKKQVSEIITDTTSWWYTEVA